MHDTVLIYIEKDNKYLMLLRNKKKVDYNKNKYIGIGGKIEPGETKEEAVVRETKEECGLALNSSTYRAKLNFIYDDYQEYIHLFTSSDFSGEVDFNCNEGELSWIDKDKIFDLPLWEGDRAFLKLMEESDEYFEMDLVYKNDVLISTKRTK